MKRPSEPRKRRSRVEVNLARFEAMDPEGLDAAQRRYRDFAIRALRIELELRARGLVEADGTPAPRAGPDAGRSPSKAAPAAGRRRARSTRRA